MKRSELERTKEILSEMKSLRSKIEADLTSFEELLRELADLFLDRGDESRIVDQERRFFRDIKARFKDLSAIRKISRRLPQLEFESEIESARDRETVQNLVEANQNLAETESALKKLNEWFRNRNN